MIKFLLCLIGASALAQQPPVPALSVPTVSEARVILTRTNAAGDTVLTVIVPKPKPQWKHYYGVFNASDAQIAYIGEMTDEAFQAWAKQGTTVASGGPQIQRWLCVFSTTNQIDATLVHSRACP